MGNKDAKRREDSHVASRNRIIIVFFLLLFFVTIYCSVWNAEEIQDIAETSRESIALELIEQTKGSVMNEINHKIQAVENLTDSLERLTGKEDIHVSIEFLDRKKNFLNFEAVALIEKDGNVVATLMDNLQINSQELFDRKVIQKAFQGNVSMNSLPSGEFCYAAPIYRDGQVKYVVSGVSGKNSIQKMITVEGGEGCKRVKACINKMHMLGFRCSMDDFGIGYSSLLLLREFDVDVLKLDRTFFGDLSNKKARDIISTLMELAQKLNIEVVAEGIEVQSQIDYLRSVRCNQVQGYFFSKPLPIDAFEKWEEDIEMV